MHYIKIPNSMNFILETEVNKVGECNLIHDILNPCKRTKNINSEYT